MKMVETST